MVVAVWPWSLSAKEKPEVTPEWLALVHYRPQMFGGYEGTIDSESFYLAEDGRTNPASELQASIKLFEEAKDKEKICLFPARYQYLQKQGWVKADYPKCEEYQQFVKDLHPAGVTLLFTDAYMNNPSSLFGHTLVRIDTGRKGTQLLAHGMNYGAFTGPNPGALYAVLGLTGGYYGGFTVKPYYDTINTYNNIENRDIWELNLDLTQEEQEMFVAHLWEIGHTQTRYYFFTQNCSYMLLEMLDAVRPSLQLADEFPVQAIPLDTLKAVYRKPGLVKNVNYRPSRQAKIINQYKQMNEPQKKAFVAAITWDKSNNLKKYGGIIDTQNISTLSDYLSNNRLDHPVSQDVIDSNYNKRTYVVPIDVTRSDGSAFKMNLVVDKTGKDLALIALTIDGKEAPESFKLADRLTEKLNSNKEVLGKVINEGDINKALDVETLDELAEKNAKGEKIVADNPKEALEEVKEKNSDIEVEDLSEEEQEEETEIPEEYKGKIDEACEKAGIKRSMLKNVMFVRNPKSITNSIEDESLKENGEEIIVLQLRGGVEKNKNILVQGDRVDRTGRYDEELTRRMDSGSKFGATVEEAETEEDLFVEYELGDGEVVRINLDEEPINSRLSDLEKLSIQEQVEKIRDEWVININHATSKEEAAIAYENANISMAALEQETGVILDPIQEEIEQEQTEVEISMEQEEQDDGYGDYIDHYGRNHDSRE